MDIEPRIGAVIGLLKSPTEDSGLVTRQVAFLLPSLHNPLNIRLLLAEVARSPSLFHSAGATLFFIDAITAAAQHKAVISNPTIQPAQFYEIVADVAGEMAVLPALAILTGVALARPPNLWRLEQMIVHHARYAPQVSRLDLTLDDRIVACLTKSQFVLERPAVDHLPLAFYWPTLLEMVYPSTQPAGGLGNVVFEHFGAFSSLLSKSLERLQNVAGAFLVQAYQYVHEAVSRTATTQAETAQKTLFFGVTLQLQGLCVQILHNKRLNAGDLCSQMLQILQEMGSISEKTGTSFESFEFVFNMCIDVLLEGRPAQACGAVQDLASQIAAQQRGVSSADIRTSGQQLFFLDVCERLLPVLSTDVADTIVLPAAYRSLSPASSQHLLEAAHAVVLKYLQVATSTSRAISASRADEQAIAYFNEVIKIFPSGLKWSQFETALAQITEALSHPFEHPSNVHGYILETLFELAKATIPGVPIRLDSGGDAEGPPTLRACYVCVLLNALPDLCDAYNFGSWLERIASMVPSGYNDYTVRERNYIRGRLADSVTALDPRLADVGIRFWFTHGANL